MFTSQYYKYYALFEILTSRFEKYQTAVFDILDIRPKLAKDFFSKMVDSRRAIPIFAR